MTNQKFERAIKKTFQAYCSLPVPYPEKYRHIRAKTDIEMYYQKKLPTVHNCLNCGDVLYAGRADKKFCCPACKNNYHNTIAELGKRSRRETLFALDKNYLYLQHILNMKQDSTALAEAKRMGFKEEYFTGESAPVMGHKYYKCFNIEYCISSRKIYNIRHTEKISPIFAENPKK